MAAPAIRGCFGRFCPHKLPLVHIFVTGRALYGNRLHPHDVLFGADLFYGVTGKTWGLPMLAFERKLAELVIESRAVPCVRVMTKLAAALRDPFVKLSFVWILVTAFAGQIGKIEFGKFRCAQFGWDVARKTGHGKVAAR